MTGQDIFMSTHKGKCATCGDEKTLDEMIRKQGIKGTYHCIDCEVELNTMIYAVSAEPKLAISPASPVIPPEMIHKSKIRKVIGVMLG